MTTETLAPPAAEADSRPAAHANPRRKFPTGRIVSRAGIIIVGLVFCFPFLWMFATSLKPT